MQNAGATQATIDLGALGSNFALARQFAAGRAVIAVVKADAYGHGAVKVARRLFERGCRHFAVTTLTEAAELRAALPDAKILVFDGARDAAQADLALELNVTPVLQHETQFAVLRQRARAQKCVLPLQIEVDTGMRRAGLAPEPALALIEKIAAAPELRLEGIYTHLACADEPELESTRQQLARFSTLLAALTARGTAPGLVHVQNSAALLAADALAGALPAAVNAVRPGLLLYGVRPAPHLATHAELAPVMSLHTRVTNLRAVQAGDAVGYGARFRASAAGRIATIPVGYADGVPWSAGGRGRVLLRGRPTPIAGRISMDLTTLDVGAAEVALGDPVLLFGADESGARLPVEELARSAGTIPYELLVRVGRRVPRIQVC